MFKAVGGTDRQVTEVVMRGVFIPDSSPGTSDNQ
jgi:hypothetical protein